jgi:PAS domain S-box-containing protein
MVRRVLSEAGRDDLLEPAQLLVSEVVTNALVHSGTAIDVSMSVDDDGVLVEVGDGSTHVPRPRHYAATASTGRGLALLDQAADDWGVVPGIRGKTVWFVLSADSTNKEPEPVDDVVVRLPTAAGEPVPPADETVTVALLNVPLLLHRAWQQHAEAVLREHLLANMDSAVDPFTEHAMAVDALTLLAEHIPAPDVDGDLDEIIARAVEPRISLPAVEVTVPRGSVQHFAVLDLVMNAAQDMARSGQLLVPVVQPELRMMREWLCRQVAGQAVGEDPVAWPPSEVLAPPAKHAFPWDVGTVSEAGVAAIAADDTDLIVAVSADALSLLGYERPAELLGQRLITIIPQRYRQAHLAGFTLHLLTGRGALLTREVNVPVLRRDGSERIVRLGIETRHVASGRTVFVATLSEVEQRDVDQR